MLVARLCNLPLAPLARQGLGIKSNCIVFRIQGIGQQARPATLRRVKDKISFKDRLMAPAGDTAFNLGKGFVAGASALGIGALCYYGLGMSSEAGAIERSVVWPEHVRQRVRDTYMYFGGSLVFTAASAIAISRSPRLMSLVMKNSWVSLIATIGAMIGSGMVCRAIPYEPGFGSKQLAWMVHSGVIGAVIAPLTLLGGPLLLRAACYTAGIVGALSTVAMCAPSDKFLNMGGPLAMGLGVVFVSSIGTWFLPPSTAIGASMFSIAVYGGLVLFGMFLLYDTQKIIRMAETYPTFAARRYDPINASIGIYMDTINIFIRLAMIMAGGGNRRK